MLQQRGGPFSPNKKEGFLGENGGGPCLAQHKRRFSSPAAMRAFFPKHDKGFSCRAGRRVFPSPRGGTATRENPNRPNNITPPITFNLPRRHSVFGPLQCWPGRRRVFRRDQKSNCEEDALLLVSALVTRGRTYFVRICLFLTRPPRPPSLNVECRSFSIRSTNYFGHGGRRSCPTLREGGRGGRPAICVLAS